VKKKLVYVAIILGAKTPQNIILRSNVTRASVYRALEELLERNLISKEGNGNDRIYLLEPAERIVTMLDSYRREVEEKASIARQVVKHIRAFQHKESTIPLVRYIEGKKELRELQREYEWRGQDIIQIAGYDAFMALYEEDLAREHQENYASKPGKIRSILVTDKKLDYPEELDIEFIKLSPAVFPMKGEISVCGDRILFFSYKEDISAIEIYSATMAETMRETLELAWVQAKRLEGGIID